MKRFISFSLLIVLILSGCQSGEDKTKDEEVKTIRLAHTGSDTHQYNVASQKFKELVEKKSQGELKVNVYGDGSLGNEDELVDQTMTGSIQMTTVAADSSLSNTIPEMNLFGIPYLFENKQDVYSKLDGKPGKDLLKLAQSKDMKGLGYWEVGFRHFTNNKREVKHPEDMKNLKLRVQSAKVWNEHLKALDAIPTPISFSELYSALDQGVVDGQENPLPTIASQKLYEVQKYISLTNHTYTPAVVLMNQDYYKNLSKQEKKIVNESIDESTTYQRKYIADQEQKIKKQLKDEGMVITEVNRDEFKKNTNDVQSEINDQVPKSIIRQFSE
ncbi:MAG: DctP family TRAP transporter solute-binding subunit [Staphylococcus equorum]|uniref:DctP family TRAP transporter solute-binding subunit n=1 Tax=Staphylococcus TaxID=1279 RepID=UPI000853272A|nr:DctP family TRAP transporter solute-binding subunit [Staphylococcus equorum]MDG0823208.1 DctP family TRAP transporter solute-binding subunit [Staphylococcus equorum]MDG0836969.1 DctP family TRAP transporter solute-binding subunit [Staphylococcus equorum]MDK9871562.1 DctP family TRAP transporter solute-binding subunit [Staphylococcus equorum]MDK9877868.1 DctP family TRAP transporter solute-binding subunit [Staphylococcus equorum]MDN5828574.1 DctP family TRAP transporter solute-binding subuni